jgi:cytochrome c peroxidase
MLNLAWTPMTTWDGRSPSLEDVAFVAITGPTEMGQDEAALVEELRGIEGYARRFDAVFPETGVTAETIGKALGVYQRTIVSGTAPFDRWIEGDADAISDSAKRGFELFNNKANCAECHAGWNFTDFSFHDIGIDDDDLGRGNVIPNVKILEHAFKTPGLRDIARRAPYMHNGSMATLEEVIAHYDGGFVERESLSREIFELDLTQAETQALIDFMLTLSDDGPDVRFPILPADNPAVTPDAKYSGCTWCTAE